jgi:precorrin-2/cobalt-factor-2 C20-methyltransferase
MKGKLYGIGVGPGDPELVTLKAKRLLGEVDCIAVPKTAAEKDSLALSIVESMLGEKKDILELLFPMSFNEKLLEDSWSKAVAGVKSRLDEGKDVAFITLGDPTVYSTYMYLHKMLKQQGYETEVVPGITSFCASAARVGVSLAENRETLAVVPSAYDCRDIDGILDNFENIVLMKISRKFSELREKLIEKELQDKAVLVSKCGLDGEMIEFDLGKVDEEKLSYFTTMIIKKNGVG